MSKVLHTPGGTIQVKSEEEEAEEAARESMIRDWVIDREPYQVASIDWAEIQSEEDAQIALDSVAGMASSLLLARVMHHGIRTQTPPRRVHVTVQVVTECEDGKLLSFEEINEDLLNG